MRFAVDVSLWGMSALRALARWAELWVETLCRLLFRVIAWWVQTARLRVTPAVLIERDGCSTLKDAAATVPVHGGSVGHGCGAGRAYGAGCGCGAGCGSSAGCGYGGDRGGGRGEWRLFKHFSTSGGF